ncbi:alkylation response protein AidB-like acyl-CoA dehydrogenase [Bradyrhizobium japonicum]
MWRPSASGSRRMVADALSHACRRQQFGQPIAHFQLVQAMLAESQTELLSAEALVLETARLMDVGGRHSENVACAKLFASEAAGRIADRCLQIHGGAGYLKSHAIEQFYRDVRVFRIIDGTSQIQQLVIARSMIGRFEKAAGGL